jgi:hypothetical protein
MDPWKDLGTRNWVPGRRPARLGLNSGEGSPESGRGRAGGWPRAYFGFGWWAWLGERSCRRVGAPAAGGGGRRDYQSRRGAAPWGRWIRRRALAVGIEGGERLSWLSGGSAPDLAMAGSGGGHGGAQERGRGSAQDAKGSGPFMGDMSACLRPKDRRRRL